MRVWNYANLMPSGPGRKPDTDPPPGLDWDFCLGPAPWVPFNEMRFLRPQRDFYDCAGGWITDFGTHRFDTEHQIMGADQPSSATAAGGRFAVSGMGDQPDLLQVAYECPGFVLSYETCSINSFGSIGRLTSGRPLHGARAPTNRPNGMAFYGGNGTLIADRLGYELIPETGPYGGSLSSREAFVASELKRTHKSGTEPSALHAQHFVRCVREGETPARKPSRGIAPPWSRTSVTLPAERRASWSGMRNGRISSTTRRPLGCLAARPASRGTRSASSGRSRPWGKPRLRLERLSK